KGAVNGLVALDRIEPLELLADDHQLEVGFRTRRHGVHVTLVEQFHMHRRKALQRSFEGGLGSSHGQFSGKLRQCPALYPAFTRRSAPAGAVPARAPSPRSAVPAAAPAPPRPAPGRWPWSP